MLGTDLTPPRMTALLAEHGHAALLGVMVTAPDEGATVGWHAAGRETAEVDDGTAG